MNSIKELQKFMKTSPSGINYAGPVDGENNEQLKKSVNQLQSLIRNKLSDHSDSSIASKAKSYTILSGDHVNKSIKDIQDMIAKIKEEKPKDKKEKPKDNIKAVQEIINLNPFGIKYNGPKDGVENKELIQTARLLENKINSITGANVSGKITDGKTIITTANDLKKTFNLINDYMKFLKEE
jgi:deoxyxylulose-5-phosphate synthase